MKKTLIFILISSLYFACLTKVDEKIVTNNSQINLAWYKAHQKDSIQGAAIGLEWCYSMMGAKVINSAVLPFENTIFKIDINAIALDKNATNKIKTLHQNIKNTAEYELKNSIDLGRYISLLIGASEHYYSITNVPENLDDILSNYTLQPSKGYVNNSSVSFKHRVIEYSNQNKTKQLFLSTETDPHNNQIVEYETIEIMENGQLRFGIFNPNKKRINAANEQHTTAGKPSKCMWCHESNINQLFTPQKDFTGYLRGEQLNDTLIKFNNSLKEQQNLLTKGVTFSNRQEHSQLELAYISFMEPSALRLSNEWNMSENEVKNRLKSLTTHVHDEFPSLGNLYDRNEVEFFAPFKSLTVSSSVREKSKIEVNHIN